MAIPGVRPQPPRPGSAPKPVAAGRAAADRKASQARADKALTDFSVMQQNFQKYGTAGVLHADKFADLEKKVARLNQLLKQRGEQPAAEEPKSFLDKLKSFFTRRATALDDQIDQLSAECTSEAAALELLVNQTNASQAMADSIRKNMRA